MFASVIFFGVWMHARIIGAIWRAHMLRGLAIATCAVTFFWSLTVLPLAETVTISFIYPLMAPFVARVMIGEQVRRSAVIAAVLGFFGVLMAVSGAPNAG